MITRFNDWLALRSTVMLGTIWCAYAFVMMSVAPILVPAQKDNILYLSNCFQLVFLPLLLVGQNLMGRAAEQRAEEDHEAIMAELAELKAIHAALGDRK